MSTFFIHSKRLHRLVSVCNFVSSHLSQDVKNKITTVLLENKNGMSYAVSTDSLIASVEFLGKTDKPDGSCYLILSDKLKEQLNKEYLTDNIITVTAFPQMAISMLQSTSGFNLSDCLHWWDDSELRNWRKWFLEPARESAGVMYWDVFKVESLLKASPSGKVIFPSFIDASKPLMVRDYHNDNWMGVFMPQSAKESEFEPTELPDWFKV